MFPSIEDRLFWLLVRTTRRLCRPFTVNGRTYPAAFKPGEIELTFYLKGIAYGYLVHKLDLA
ncbi:MAG: hypothetical protein ACLFVD_02645 [Dehalococcoidia bacterium]